MPTDQIELAASRLREAQDSGDPCAPVRTLIGAADVGAAYAVASINIDRRIADGRHRVGRKIGLTSLAVQAQLGVDRPDFGSLLDDMVVTPGGTVPDGLLLQPKVEAEIAFLLGRDLDGPLESVEEVVAAIDRAYAAIEVVDSRVAGWDISIADTVADNASSGLFVTSADGVLIDDVVPREVEMTLEVNGTVVSWGNGAACLGDPLLAVLWLARAARDVGDPLRAGEVLLSGALGPMAVVLPGDHVVAHVSGLGSVEVRFAAKESSDG
jgi:2-keto-4-pentenoate hydratase